MGEDLATGFESQHVGVQVVVSPPLLDAKRGLLFNWQ